jgi:hypothetical protein
MLKKPASALILVFAFAAHAQVLNLAVTQATINKTICVVGWTKTVRPSVSYTSRIKKQLLVAQGKTWVDRSGYELDHWMPIELGGHPHDPGNLVLQPWLGADGAHKKDVVETRMKRLVCVKRVTLAAAQKCMHNDWRSCPLK